MATTIFRGRIAPLFDSAQALLIVDFEGGREIRQEKLDVGELEAIEKVEVLVTRRVDTLLCGAISRTALSQAESGGLQVYPWVTGETAKVLSMVSRAAWMSGQNVRTSTMKVAISATGPDLSARVDPRFGRCRYIVFVDDAGEVDAVENTYRDLGGGAGIQTASLVTEKGAQALLTGSCGPNAFGTLNAASIQVFTNVEGKLEEVVDRFRKSDYSPSLAPTAAPGGPLSNDSAGMGLGAGGGRGFGGRGMGAGMGAGMGGGRRRRRRGPGGGPGGPGGAGGGGGRNRQGGGWSA